MVDLKGDGIINEQQFIKLIKIIEDDYQLSLDPDKILYFIDPFKRDTITFSSVISIFSNIIYDKRN